MDGSHQITGTRPSAASPPTPPELIHLTDALLRLFAVAGLYPANHVRVTSLAEPALEALRAWCAGRPALAYDVGPGDVRVEGLEFPATVASARSLHADLANLGLKRLEIRADASLEDLLDLARVLRTASQARGSTSAFEAPDLSGLPATISVGHHDFGSPSFRDPEDGARPVDQHLAAVVGALATASDPAAPPAARPVPAHQGIPVPAATGTPAPPPGEAARPGGEGDAPLPTLDQIRAVVAELLSRAREADAPEPAAVALAPKDRREVLRAIGEALARRSVRLRGGPDTESVGEVLRDAEERIARAAPGVAAARVIASLKRVIDEYLRDTFRRETLRPTSVPDGKARRKEVAPGSIAEVTAEIEAFAGVPEADPSPLADGQEYLALLLHVLRSPDPPDADGRPVRVRRAELATALTRLLADTPALLGEGPLEACVGEVVLAGDVEALDRVLPPALEAVRAVDPLRVAPVVLAPLRPPRPHALLMLWPYLVDELVRGVPDSHRHLEDEMIGALARLDATDMRPQIGRLVARPGLRVARPSRRLFEPPHPELYGLYEVLLAVRDVRTLAPLVLEGFFRYPPATPAFGVLTVLEPGEERAKGFLARLLRESQGTGETPALRQLCASTIAERLRGVPRDRRGEDWVLRALTALRDLPGPEAADVARRILTDRRWGLFPRWPEAARHAAKVVASRAAAAPRATAGPPPAVAGARPVFERGKASREPAMGRPR